MRACRRRDASAARPWRGRITLTEGADDRGAYLECADNGLGMGIRELTEALSPTGTGALGHCALVGDLSVTTRRPDGPVLRARVSESGVPPRVETGEPGGDSFTVVRLRPSAPIPAGVDLLRAILWVADYEVTATGASGTETWAAGRLSAGAPIGAGDPFAPDAARVAALVIPTASPRVWWCDGEGGVLTDGLWTGERLFGAVVNLTGTAGGGDEAEVERLLHAQIPSLLAEGADVLDHRWLSALTPRDPGLADAIAARAASEPDRPWTMAGHQIDLGRVGCFPADEALFRAVSHGTHHPGREVWWMPRQVQLWRLLAWRDVAGFGGLDTTGTPPGPLARPSDQVLLQDGDAVTRGRLYGPGPQAWLDAGRPVPWGHVLTAARATGRRVAEVVDRLASLGFEMRPSRRSPSGPRRRTCGCSATRATVCGRGSTPPRRSRRDIWPRPVSSPACRPVRSPAGRRRSPGGGSRRSPDGSRRSGTSSRTPRRCPPGRNRTTTSC
ncbi:hypothetical protein [Spongiactinospora sp. TRM90649]|uniref:wHTH domain-containing protein n=1 Tax=Spongiactinospora sp. TRM90649 TaxID=3031114 RepID=UPI0023F67683|nr:hypothetical protein [Spongiactinospora sp. TRM90649]MDF5755356.1 hypothetical protein [Spongiactinospora sp. TRM90649]